jgi:Contractile injection system spike tip protein
MDFIIQNGDELMITITPPALVPALLAPVPLVASGFSTINGLAVCVEGDENPQSLQAPTPYTSPPYTVPGMGTVAVTLGPSNKTSVATDQGKAILVKGSTMTAKFTVSVPAQMPPPVSTPDPLATKTGTAVFITTNTLAQAE